MNIIKSLAVVGIVAIAAAAPAGAQTVLQKAVISSGGGTATSSSHRLDYTISEPVTGMATNGTTVGQFGFWTANAGIALSADNERSGAITAMRLAPNPVVGETQLTLMLARATEVELTLHDARGKRIASKLVGHLDAGEHIIALDFTGLASGNYSLSASIDGAMTRIPLAIVR